MAHKQEKKILCEIITFVILVDKKINIYNWLQKGEYIALKLKYLFFAACELFWFV